MPMTRTFGTIIRLALIAGLVFSLTGLTPLALGQTTRATVLGIVKDEKGGAIANAKVSAKNVATGLTRETTADGDGRYRISELSPGVYEVTAQQQGFAPEVRSEIDLTVGRDAVVDFTLKVGGIQESALIKGDAPLVDTTSSAVRWKRRAFLSVASIFVEKRFSCQFRLWISLSLLRV